MAGETEMNRPTRTLLFVAILATTIQAAANKRAAPAAGVKTPGVQIPFSSLVAEAEIASAANPGWLYFSGSLYVPNGDSIAKIDAKTNKPGDPIAGLSTPCGGMVNVFGSLWSAQCGTGVLQRIDSKTEKITATINSGLSHAPGVIAASSDSVWLLTDDKTTLARIDPDQNLVVGEIRLMQGCQSLTFAEKSLWVACPSRNKVMRIDPATNVVLEAITVSIQPISIAPGAEGSVWVLCRKEGKIDRIDTKTNKVAKTIDLAVPGVDGAIAFGEGWLWATQKGFPLTRIDATLETVVQQFHGPGGGDALTTSKGALWLSTPAGVSRIDPKRVLATLPAE